MANHTLSLLVHSANEGTKKVVVLVSGDIVVVVVGMHQVRAAITNTTHTTFGLTGRENNLDAGSILLSLVVVIFEVLVQETVRIIRILVILATVA